MATSSTDIANAKTAISCYYWVKDNIVYDFCKWGTTVETLRKKRGHCAAKSELLVSMLRGHGITARYVEGYKTGLKPILPIMLGCLDTHMWVEAEAEGEWGKWLTLDPAPDDGITSMWGDTMPGICLGIPERVVRYDEFPGWYKDGYNSAMFWPLRISSNVILRWYRSKST